MNTDRIEKSVEIKAARPRVWQALTNYSEFGQWFGVKMETPFVVGQAAHGQITYPGYEHLKMEVVVRVMEPPARFVYTWHPYAIDPAVDYSGEIPTEVAFHLEETGAGTRLTVVESGFDRLPPERRETAFRMNSDGWAQQMENIVRYVAAS